MNVEEAVKYLRYNILDDVSDIVTDWTTIDEDDLAANQFLWTNEELVGYINEAQIEAARRSLLIQDVTTISITNGVAEYALPSTVLKIKQAILSSNGKEIFPRELMDFSGMQNWTTLEGTPIYYIKDWTTGYIRLYRTPDADNTLTLYIYRLPTTTLSWDNSDASFEIQDQYIIPMLDYAAYKAYNKQDSDTFDPAIGARFLAKFTQEFQSTSAYSEIRKSRSVHKKVKYGGY